MLTWLTQLLQQQAWLILLMPPLPPPLLLVMEVEVALLVMMAAPLVTMLQHQVGLVLMAALMEHVLLMLWMPMLILLPQHKNVQEFLCKSQPVAVKLPRAALQQQLQLQLMASNLLVLCCSRQGCWCANSSSSSTTCRCSRPLRVSCRQSSSLARLLPGLVLMLATVQVHWVTQHQHRYRYWQLQGPSVSQYPCSGRHSSSSSRRSSGSRLLLLALSPVVRALMQHSLLLLLHRVRLQCWSQASALAHSWRCRV